MNVLVRSFGGSAGEKTYISAEGDVFHWSASLRPSILFDCNVVVCGSVAEKRDIRAILELGSSAYITNSVGNTVLE